MTFLTRKPAFFTRLPSGWPVRILLPVCVLLPVFAIAPVLGSHMTDQRNPAALDYVQSYQLQDVALAQSPRFAISAPSPGALQSELDDLDAGDDLAANTGPGGSQRLADFWDTNDDPIVLSGGQRLMNVDYDLSIQGAQSGDLAVNKPVNLNGRPAGVLNVSIDQNSQLHLSSTDLSQLLPDELFSRLNVQSGYVAFDTLRTSGIDISYDPVHDTLAINL